MIFIPIVNLFYLCVCVCVCFVVILIGSVFICANKYSSQQRDMSLVGVDRESFFDSCFNPSISSLELYLEVMENDTFRLWNGDEVLIGDEKQKHMESQILEMRSDFVNQLSIFSIDWFPEFICEELECYCERFIKIYAALTQRLGQNWWYWFTVNPEDELKNFVQTIKFLRRWSLYPSNVRGWFNSTYSTPVLFTEFPSDVFARFDDCVLKDELLTKCVKKIEEMETVDNACNFYSYRYVNNDIVVTNTCLPSIATSA